ncbi:MAG: hypothetical protein FWC01_00045 [Treponema sp.]|nr:hypothetical protein [Treponema sp.]
MLELRKTFLIFAGVICMFAFFSCDVPMGLGDPIDWEPPVLTLDPMENPKHVRLGTKITGTAQDNITVEKVIMRDAISGEELFRATLLPNDRFEIALNFTQEHNNQKMSVEIVAFDRIGNAAVANLTIIVDLNPPIVESAWIERSPGKIYWLEPYYGLHELETTDLNAEKRENMHRFQNGWFNFRAKLRENETRIENVRLDIYDTQQMDTPLISQYMDTTLGSLYSPFWLIKEEELLAKGAELFGNEYITNYYDNGARYYYYVSISAFDRSQNEGTMERTEPQDFFAMWEKADIPKGIVDQIIGNTVYKRMPIPVQVFDDDQLEYAYVGMLTRNQWLGYVSIDGPVSDSNPNGGTNIPQVGVTAEELNNYKINWLHERLRSGDNVLNWKHDPRYTNYPLGGDLITERVDGKNVDDILINLDTGSHDNDYGEFVLFTIVRDRKISPHTGTGDRDTLRSRWKGRHFEINIIDDNMPLIVFDTVDTSASDYQVGLHLGGIEHEPILQARTGNSPEENTFPRLKADGETFEINGYTLRENNSQQNSVQRFRMAWIPHSLLTSAQAERELIAQVENFLRWHRDPMEPNRQNMPANQLPSEHIQYWVLDDSDYTQNAQIHGSANIYMPHGTGLIEGTEQILSSQNSQGVTVSTRYQKQVFRKQFNILGGVDDLRNEYRNFSVKNASGVWTRENETKLFVFCTIDNMQKAVFRTIRLLPNKTPPSLGVYDITARNMNLPTNVTGMPNGIGGAVTTIPSPFYYSADGTMTSNYIEARNVFNNAAFGTLKGASGILSDTDRTVPFQSYPRGTQLKYWVTAEKSGDIAIQNITMEDVTLSGSPVSLGSGFVQADRALSYVEWFPEVTQRVFRFTATDTLGNRAQIQRTIAITSGATLTSIESDRESGTYGINQKIKLFANFDGAINTGVLNASGQLSGQQADLNNILLNVRFQKAGGEYVYEQLPCIEVGTLSLVFEYTVKEDDIGKLETGFDNPSFYDPSSFGGTGTSRPSLNKPISLLNNTVIIDRIRNDPAFTPGNVTGFTWPNANYSLQDPANGKNIQLNGVRPRITSLSISGKTPILNDGFTEYYFKSGETISIALFGDKDIRNAGTPQLGFRLRTPISTTVITNTTVFGYERPSGSTGLVFTLPVDNFTNTSLTARLDQIALVNVSTIVDDYNNPVTNASVSDENLSALLGTNVRIFIDRRPPPGLPLTPIAQAATLNGVAIPSNQRNFNFNPSLVIPNLATADAVEPWPVTRQYSLNGGNSWIDFTNTVSLANGTHNLLVRYVDRAGNPGNAVGQEVVVNANFPRLNAINAVQPNSIYNSGSNLEFTLDFNDVVFMPTGITPAPVVSITLADLTQTADATYGGVSPTFSITLNATSIAQANASQTVRFAWPDATGKDMLNGLRVTAMNLSGLRDTFGNEGPSTGMSFTSSVATMPENNPSGTTYTTNYNLNGIKVNTIIPVVRSREPQTVVGRTAGSNITVFSNDPDAIPTGRTSIANGSVSADNRTIRLNFGKEMQKGNGTITIRPRGNYAIPPVFENDGYYLQVSLTDGSETRRTTKADGFTYIMGFADVFNNASTANKNILIGSANLSAPAVSNQTGLSSGRYLRTTHGLTGGNGLSGNYGNAATVDTGGAFPGTSNLTTPFLSGFHAPGPHITGAMIPDLSLKWVLRYNIGNIHDSVANSDVSQIRSVLTSIKWRWQEIAVTSSDVTLINAGTVTNGTVEIKLPEPLLPGLQWDVYYTAGTFTDTAGNPVAAEGYTGTTMNATSSYWFWSRGVQTPVVRVDRKSYDARAGTNLTGAWNKSGWGGYNANGYNGAITDFNTVAYRIETETPGARIFYNTITGANNTGSATGAFSGVVNSTAFTSNNITTTDPVSWHGPRANVTTTARAATTFQYTSNAHGFGVAGTVLQVRVETQDYWLRVVSGTTFRLYNTQAAASTTTAGNGVDAGQPITINGYQTTGRWVRPNMIFRNQSTVNIDSATDATGHYNLLVNASTTIPKYVNRVGNSSRYYGFRSYNKDALRSELDALGLTITPTPAEDGSPLNAAFTGYTNYQASKNYVAAIARVNHNDSGWAQTTASYQSNRGFEGVFRTVIMINQSNRTIENNNAPMFLGGVTAINAIPTVPAFPVRDGVATIDARFIKAYHRSSSIETEFYWVSTEMVCEWYVQNFGWGAGGSYSRQGDWSDWITAGYGDLSHVYQLETW